MFKPKYCKYQIKYVHCVFTVRCACTTEEFTCYNGDCIDKNYVNDGVIDCVDGSDEGKKKIREHLTDIPPFFIGGSGSALDCRSPG